MTISTNSVTVTLTVQSSTVLPSATIAFVGVEGCAATGSGAGGGEGLCAAGARTVSALSPWCGNVSQSTGLSSTSPRSIA